MQFGKENKTRVDGAGGSAGQKTQAFDIRSAEHGGSKEQEIVDYEIEKKQLIYIYDHVRLPMPVV